MSTQTAVDPLGLLIEQLNDGNVLVARRALERFEPYLRMAVRRRLHGPLRAKLDSMDVVQSIWADFLAAMDAAEWRFEDPAQLRAFLIRMASNRVIDKHRKHRRALQHERPIHQLSTNDQPRAKQPRPSEVSQGRELWDQLLRQCPPAHRDILRLRREGRTLAEIASECGLHEGSVRRILYELARKLPGATSKNT